MFTNLQSTMKMNADNAFNDKNFDKAINLYKQLYKILSNDQYYERAKVLKEIISCKTELLLESSRNGITVEEIKKAKNVIVQRLSLLKNLARHKLKPFQQEEINNIHDKLMDQFKLTEQAAYWNRAVALSLLKFDDIRERIQNHKQTIKAIIKYYRLNNKNERIEENNHSLYRENALEFASKIAEYLSDNYYDLHKNNSLSATAKIKNLITSSKYLVQVFKLQGDINPNNCSMELHLSYLNIFEKIFTINQDQEALKQITKHINENDLLNKAKTDSVKMEIYGQLSLVAKNSEPRDLTSAKNLANKMIKLGAFPGNQALSIIYNEAKSFITEHQLPIKKRAGFLKKSSGEKRKITSLFNEYRHEKPEESPNKRVKLNDDTVDNSTVLKK